MTMKLFTTLFLSRKKKKSSNSLTVNTVKSNRPAVDLNWPEENTFVLKIFANNKPYIFVL